MHKNGSMQNSRNWIAGKLPTCPGIWTVLYTQPSCYNWPFQHHLRLEGLALSWVGTGRMIFSLNYTEHD